MKLHTLQMFTGNKQDEGFSEILINLISSLKKKVKKKNTIASSWSFQLVYFMRLTA